MSTSKAPTDIRFKSSLAMTTFVTRGFGLVLVLFSFDFLGGWLRPSLARLPYMLGLLPLGLFFLAAGVAVLLGSCQIEIRDGQLSFRRFVAWNSVPLDSVVAVRRLWAPGIYLKACHVGKCHRLVFTPENWKAYWGPSPVIEALQEVCRRNAGSIKGDVK